MKHPNKHITLFLIFASVLFLSSCSKEVKKETKKNTLKEIIIADVNSSLVSKEYIGHYYAGVYMAIDEINANGGVLDGIPLRVIVKNDFSNQIEAYNRAKTAVEKENALVVMGAFLPQTALGLTRYAKDASVPTLITGSSTETIYTDMWANYYTFRLKEGYDNHINAVVNEINQDNDIKTVSVLTYTNTEGDYISEKIKSEFVKLNSDIIFTEDIRIPQGLPLATNIHDKTYYSLSRSIIIAINGNDISNLVLTLQRNRSVSNKKVFILFGGESEWLDTLGEYTPNGWVATGFPWYSIDTPTNKEFITKYKNKYKHNPRYASYLGYTAVYAIAQGINIGKPYDNSQDSRNRIRDGLQAVQFENMMGDISLRKDFRSNISTYIGVLRPYNIDKKQSNNTTFRILDIRMYNFKHTSLDNVLLTEEKNLEVIKQTIEAVKDREKNKRYIPLKQQNTISTDKSSGYYSRSP